jgi:hypothetical protein
MLPGALPIFPQSMLAQHPSLPKPALSFAEIGWPEATRSVATTFSKLPDPAHTAIVGDSYWSASAISYYGPALGLPPAYSPNRGFATLATPPDSATQVLFIGDDPRPLLGYFTGARPVGEIHTGTAKPSVADGMPLWLVQGRQQSWTAIWPKLFTT